MSPLRRISDTDLQKIVKVARDLGGARLSAGTGIYRNGNPETVSILASAIASIASELLSSRAEKKKGTPEKGTKAKRSKVTTGAEKRLAGRLLQMASDEFSNHGCNDFDLVGDGGMLAKEAKEFRRAYHDWNGDPESFLEDAPGRTDLADSSAMRYLAHLLEEEGREGPGP